MIIETLLSLAISHAVPQLPPPVIFQALTPPSYAKSFGASSSSSFRSSSSFSSGSSFRSTSSFRPSSSPSFSSPRISTPAPAPRISTPPPAPKISAPPKVSSSAPANNIVRINKQTTSAPKTVSAPPVKNTISAPKTTPTSPAPVVTRETYVERYNDSGIMGNPWFWMYMFDNNRQSAPVQQQVPTQVIVKDSEGESVKIPENQMIVRKYSHNPLREFAVFSLGGGLGVLLGRRFSL